MSSLRFRPLFEAMTLAVVAFAIHFVALRYFWSTWTDYWQYSIVTIYGFFFVCSVIIVLWLIRMKQRNIDSVGNTFMLFTCVKAAAAYVMLHPILQAHHPHVKFEKANFFAVFAIFLAIETIVSIRMLQKR
ncbi:hypothetical protein [Flavobacterium longum]|uniref:hypothetical protein n=1 Tax=Flavobacterium longum TaxID=1299340 RepID=UPI0039E93C10